MSNVGHMTTTDPTSDASAVGSTSPTGSEIEGHAGTLAVAAARAHGVETMFTLSGAHVFPMYDGAVKADPPMRLVDVRHEQTAAFAAEATGKLTRRPGLAVLTAGPGVTNGISAIAQATFAGSPMVVVGGRAPANRWGSGSLQELDHPPIVAPVAKDARTLHLASDVLGGMDAAFATAGASHRGPVFVDVPMDEFFNSASGPLPTGARPAPEQPDPDALRTIGRLLAEASRPVLVLGTDVWADGAEEAALRLVEEAGLPAITNGMGRGVVPGGHPLLVTKARSAAFGGADLVVVVGTPLDFRLGYGVFGGKDGATPARVVHVADSAAQVSGHAELAASAYGDLTLALDGVLAALQAQPRKPDHAAWVSDLQAKVGAAAERDAQLLAAEADPVHPARIYGELVPRLADDAVVIGDGGDFVSFAGKYVEPKRPGGWLDPGPYGCLGAGLGAAIAARIARPSAQVVLLLGDGAAGFSLMDVDTLVRHDLPVVMVMGNNSAWGLEKGPMQMLYGYDVAADLAPRTAYHEVVKALGGAGEVVTDPRQIGPALDRAFAAGVPYLVNIITDVDAAYPRATFGI
ncbi:acetolactate synthase-1/2/3 large subunit [Nocardioides zeae]|uniref:Acetolactate synthase-1/2/3 large subunit n=3 Tax=Nocardioides zeae TaxID=1457234 RepID=A0ACC6IGU9_9ACTN|nr:acetolactate synthase-1/2/3 large subunit [Nocardioides zeae]MDR6172996.1 acetolactate synthase-1/2/3 large subunit [Nocardioides zeae]MDR6209990.1 acetolactate synthase-1/2/3 large subunit [Nocardioides zeae]